jgi:hypothetical protein
MPARHVEVRDEEQDRHKARRFTVAESVGKQTHFPLMVPSQATAAPQKYRLAEPNLSRATSHATDQSA